MEAEAFRAPRPKGTVTKAVFSKGYSGNGMMYPNYNDKPKARVEKSGFFAGETSKCDSWLRLSPTKISGNLGFSARA